MCFLEERALQIMQKFKFWHFWEYLWNLGDSAFNIYIQPHCIFLLQSESYYQITINIFILNMTYSS